MKIPINIPFVGKEEISVVTFIFKNGALTSSASQGGKYVQDFEKSVSSFVNSKYTVAVNSGTATLKAASSVLSLPIHPKVTTKNIEFIAKTVSEILWIN